MITAVEDDFVYKGLFDLLQKITNNTKISYLKTNYFLFFHFCVAMFLFQKKIFPYRVRVELRRHYQTVDMKWLLRFCRVAPNLLFRFRSISSHAKMPSNVEIKARVKDFEAFKKKAREISASEGNL